MKKWNHWFTYDNKEFTQNSNMKSPVYVLSCNWISEIWQKVSAELLKKSFEVCGVNYHHLTVANGNLRIRMDNLHSALKTILTEKTLMQSIIYEDIELAEAELNMNNVNEDVFDSGPGEDEIEFGGAKDQNETEEEILRTLKLELSNDLESDQPSQYQIQNNLHTELNELPALPIAVAENVSQSHAYFDLAREPLPQAEATSHTVAVNNTTPAVTRVRRTRRTKLQMIAYRV